MDYAVDGFRVNGVQSQLMGLTWRIVVLDLYIYMLTGW